MPLWLGNTVESTRAGVKFSKGITPRSILNLAIGNNAFYQSGVFSLSYVKKTFILLSHSLRFSTIQSSCYFSAIPRRLDNHHVATNHFSNCKSNINHLL